MSNTFHLFMIFLIALLIVCLSFNAQANPLCQNDTVLHEKLSENNSHCNGELPGNISDSHTCADCLIGTNTLIPCTGILTKTDCAAQLPVTKITMLLYDLIYFSEKPPKQV